MVDKESLSIYLLLDTSGSMHGEPILSMQNGLQIFVSALQRNIRTFGRINLSVITFGDHAEVSVPLTPIEKFNLPNLVPYGCSALGEALMIAAHEIDANNKVDDYLNPWRPEVFIVTDGEPTDNIYNGLYELGKRNIANLVLCIAGQETNPEAPWISRITDNVVTLDTADSTTLFNYVINADN